MVSSWECCCNPDLLYLQSLKNSYVADVYDQLLTQAEIQEQVSIVNGEYVNTYNFVLMSLQGNRRTQYL